MGIGSIFANIATGGTYGVLNAARGKKEGTARSGAVNTLGNVFTGGLYGAGRAMAGDQSWGSAVTGSMLNPVQGLTGGLGMPAINLARGMAAGPKPKTPGTEGYAGPSVDPRTYAPTQPYNYGWPTASPYQGGREQYTRTPVTWLGTAQPPTPAPQAAPAQSPLRPALASILRQYGGPGPQPFNQTNLPGDLQMRQIYSQTPAGYTGAPPPGASAVRDSGAANPAQWQYPYGQAAGSTRGDDLATGIGIGTMMPAVGGVARGYRGWAEGQPMTGSQGWLNAGIRQTLDPAGLIFTDPVDPLAGFDPRYGAQVTSPINEAAFAGGEFAPYEQQAQAYQAQLAGRNPYGIETGEQFREQTQGVANLLGARALGQRPSVAEQQFRQSQESNLAQAMAAAASQRGTGNAGLQQRNLQGALSQLNLGAAGKMAELRAAEQAQAEEALGRVLQSARTTDVDRAKAEADINAQLEQTRGALQTDFLGQGMDAARYGALSRQDLEQLIAKERAALMQARFGSAEGAQAGNTGIFRSGLSAVGKWFGAG